VKAQAERLLRCRFTSVALSCFAAKMETQLLHVVGAETACRHFIFQAAEFVGKKNSKLLDDRFPSTACSSWFAKPCAPCIADEPPGIPEAGPPERVDGVDCWESLCYPNSCRVADRNRRRFGSAGSAHPRRNRVVPPVPFL